VETSSYYGVDRRTTASNNRGDWTSLKAWAQAIGIVGIPGAIAIFLVYVGAQQIPALVRGLDVVTLEVRKNGEALREHQASIQSLVRIAQKACMNAAKDDSARQNCFDR
jgi:hypothetical protein